MSRFRPVLFADCDYGLCGRDVVAWTVFKIDHVERRLKAFGQVLLRACLPESVAQKIIVADSVATLLKAAENDWHYHGLNFSGHLLSRNTIGGLKPAPGCPEDSPGRGGRQQ